MNKHQPQSCSKKWRNQKVRICPRLQELQGTITQSITSFLRQASTARTFPLTLEFMQTLKLDVKWVLCFDLISKAFCTFATRLFKWLNVTPTRSIQETNDTVLRCHYIGLTITIWFAQASCNCSSQLSHDRTFNFLANYSDSFNHFFFQGYHVCNDGLEGPQGSKFLCTNGTLFSQKLFTCDHWYNVDCGEAQHYYQLNVDPEENPYTKDQLKKNRELEQQLHH